MASEIDDFIRDQKSKIQAERDYLGKFKQSESSSHNENESSSFIFKMNEGENMKNKYKQELRSDFSNVASGEENGRRSRKNDNNDQEGLLRGLRYSNSANVRKERERNKEYNEFKKAQERKFQNRFSDKKGRESDDDGENRSSLERNPIVKPEPYRERERSLSQERRTERIETAISHYPEPKFHPQPPQNKSRVVESKLEELERKVEELRNFRIQNPLIVYPGEQARYSEPAMYQHAAPAPPAPQAQNDLRYSTTNLGRSHLRFLDDVEKKLHDIENKYSQSKSEIINRYKSPRRPAKAMPSILDDDLIFEEDKLVNNSNSSYLGAQSRKPSPETNQGIVPLGPTNAEEIKRKKQESYRRDLERQMNDKQKSSRRRDSDDTNSDLFFDKFTNRATKPRNSEPYRSNNPQRNDSSDYDFYSSHNPLDSNPVDVSDSILSNRQPYNNNSNSSQRRKDDFSLWDSKSRPEHASSSSITNLSNRNYQQDAKRDEYADELKRQIDDRRRQKEEEKRRFVEFERKKNEEIANYNPFGRGGGGAPLKNNRGENVADLRGVLGGGDSSPRQMYHEPISIPVTARPTPRVNFASPVQQPLPDDGDATFARGGHGIFGQALSQEDKERADKYKDELQAQIMEKKRQKELEKEQERVREANEQRRIEEQQRDMQAQFERERAAQIEKEKEKQRALEETRQAALEEKKKAKRQRTPPPSFPEIQPVPTQVRSSSPVIQDKTATEVEALARPAPIKREDTRIMGQIDSLRQQLENEKQRIELALVRQKDQVEIYDPRLHEAKKPASNTTTHKPQKKDDVFQAVLDKKGPLSVRRNRPKEDPVSGGSRPESGHTENGDLDAYLKEQERILERMTKNDFSKLELSMPKMNPHDIGLGRPSTQNSMQLEADTDFINFYGSSTEFGMPRASYSRDLEMSRPPSQPLSNRNDLSVRRPSSNSSLNIEELTRKNKERLRKLKRLQDENGSQQSSDEILNRIITNSELGDSETDFLTFRK